MPIINEDINDRISKAISVSEYLQKEIEEIKADDTLSDIEKLKKLAEIDTILQTYKENIEETKRAIIEMSEVQK
jgi:uncharacterized membrane protein YukC